MSAPVDETRLAKIEVRANAATPGPWSPETLGAVLRSDGRQLACVSVCGDPPSTRDANAAFIAHAREDVPALVAEVRRLTDALAEAIAQRDAAREDLAAVEEYLAGIVRAWQCAGDEERRMADVFVTGLRREIEEARDSRQGEWWEVSRG